MPYLVMEYVDGAPITAYADAHGLSVRARVALAARVCDAVAYAHQRLIVHRDLKPSNVLVGGPPETPDVKLLDFGIAKLLDQDEGLTRTRAALTPAYAAPEQVTGGEVTTATDVYALGVLLYRLLAGRRPYDLAGATAAHTERVITAEVPPPPSVAAREARTEPHLPTPAAASSPPPPVPAPSAVTSTRSSSVRSRKSPPGAIPPRRRSATTSGGTSRGSPWKPGQRRRPTAWAGSCAGTGCLRAPGSPCWRPSSAGPGSPSGRPARPAPKPPGRPRCRRSLWTCSPPRTPR